MKDQRIDGAQPPLVQRGIRRGAAQQQIRDDHEQAEYDEYDSGGRSGQR